MPDAVVLSQRHATLIHRTWVAIFALVVLDGVWMHKFGIQLAHKTLIVVPFTAVLLFAVSLFYRTVRREGGLWLAAQVANQLVVGTLGIAVLSYLGARLAYPLHDEQFIAADRFLGIDWQSYIGWMDHHPLISHILALSYMSTDPEVMVFLMLLCFCKQHVPLHRFVLQFLMGAFVTVVIATLWPSLGPYVYGNTDPASYPNLGIAGIVEYKFDELAMRSHTMRILPEAFQGIVAFPSFHSTIAVIIIYASRVLPWPAVRFFVIVLNVLMMVSTPASGGHYPVDTLAGILIGFAVIAWFARVLPEENGRSGRI